MSDSAELGAALRRGQGEAGVGFWGSRGELRSRGLCRAPREAQGRQPRQADPHVRHTSCTGSRGWRGAADHPCGAAARGQVVCLVSLGAEASGSELQWRGQQSS